MSEEAAEVHDPGLRAGGGRKTELSGVCRRPGRKLSGAIDDGGVSSVLHVPADPSGHDARTKFRGVCRQPSGKFGAKISGSKGQTCSQRWLGTFDTAEDAARAFDAAAVCDWKGNAALSLGGFDGAGTRHDDLSLDLLPAEWQQVHDLLKDMESTDDREALIEGAAILRRISLAGHGDGDRGAAAARR